MLVLQKARAIWGQRGRLIVEADRQQAIELIEEAVAAGARCFRACEVLEIDVRTLQRWKRALRRWRCQATNVGCRPGAYAR